MHSQKDIEGTRITHEVHIDCRNISPNGGPADVFDPTTRQQRVHCPRGSRCLTQRWWCARKFTRSSKKCSIVRPAPCRAQAIAVARPMPSSCLRRSATLIGILRARHHTAALHARVTARHVAVHDKLQTAAVVRANTPTQ